MSTLGQKLKERREDLGYTLQEMQEKTKISSAKLKAIEENDFSYFKHEQSYLKFYVQYYAQSLHIPFSEIEDDFNQISDELSQTLLLKRDEIKHTSNENIQKRINKNKEIYRPSYESKKMKFDRNSFSSVGMILLSIVIVLALGYGVVKYVIPLINEPDNTSNIPNVPEVPIQPTEPDDVEDESPETNNPSPVEEPSVITVTQVDPQLYEIDLDGSTDSKLRITFGSDTWIELSINGVATKNPASRIYQQGESIELLLNPDEHEEILVHMGTMVSNEFYIDDQPIVLDETIVNYNSGLRIVFRLD